MNTAISYDEFYTTHYTTTNFRLNNNFTILSSAVTTLYLIKFNLDCNDFGLTKYSDYLVFEISIRNIFWDSSDLYGVSSSILQTWIVLPFQVLNRASVLSMNSFSSFKVEFSDLSVAPVRRALLLNIQTG